MRNSRVKYRAKIPIRCCDNLTKHCRGLLFCRSLYIDNDNSLTCLSVFFARLKNHETPTTTTETTTTVSATTSGQYSIVASVQSLLFTTLFYSSYGIEQR